MLSIFLEIRLILSIWVFHHRRCCRFGFCAFPFPHPPVKHPNRKSLWVSRSIGSIQRNPWIKRIFSFFSSRLAFPLSTCAGVQELSSWTMSQLKERCLLHDASKHMGNWKIHLFFISVLFWACKCCVQCFVHQPLGLMWWEGPGISWLVWHLVLFSTCPLRNVVLKREKQLPNWIKCRDA